MSNRIASAAFKFSVSLISAALAVWLTVTGHTLLLGGLLMAFVAVLAAVVFGLLYAGEGKDRLSIWAGPFWSIRGPDPS